MGSLQDLVGYGRYEEAMALATIFVALLSHVPLFAQPRSGYRAQPFFLFWRSTKFCSQKKIMPVGWIYTQAIYWLSKKLRGNICTSSDLYVKVP